MDLITISDSVLYLLTCLVGISGGTYLMWSATKLAHPSHSYISVYARKFGVIVVDTNFYLTKKSIF